MNSVTLLKVYNSLPFCEKEILRYAGCKTATDEVIKLLRECLDEVTSKLSYKVCYCELPIKSNDNICDFEVFSLKSEALSKNLSGCEKAIIFAATVGVEIDRLISKYGRISPAKALMFQAIGASQIETLCDTFCDDLNLSNPRFSPGYADLPLTAQKEIFVLLDCPKKIGLSLTDSMLMSPSKSVTAIVGISKDKNKKINKCTLCDKTDCVFRGAI